MAAFRFARNRRPRNWLRGLGAGIGRSGRQGRYRFEQALAVAEVEPKLLQIGIGEFAQYIASNAVLCERLRMVSEPLFSEPARDVDHSVPPSWMESSTTG